VSPKDCRRPVDLPGAAAEHVHAADAVERLDAPAQHPVGVLRELAGRARGRERHQHHRRGVRVHALDARLLDARGKPGQRAVDAVTHLLRGHGGVLVEVEARHHHREALEGVGAQLVEAGDGVELLLDLVGDLRLDLLRRRSREHRAHHHDREVDVGEAVDAEAAQARDADHHQREDEHPGEHRAPDTQGRQPLHRSTPCLR